MDNACWRTDPASLLCDRHSHLPACTTQDEARVRHLLDYRGFLDIRYACLSVGAVIASLGVYVPFYYIGTSSFYMSSNGIGY